MALFFDLKLENPIYLDPNELFYNPHEEEDLSTFSLLFRPPYDPSKDETGISIVVLPDGRKIIDDGHHRTSSAKGTGQLVKVGEIITLEEQL